ncbi:formate dehydrogenase subunit delta [Methylocapsa acidiphila]|uniref:formate dehydrogenase subunit delta n=1 Tax=Methylocapsa acidiphila TaxID=133552 RepID=UPI000402C623|nr:formate dehydrogenase subunit delta [Methylocapsa acidiphila]
MSPDKLIYMANQIGKFFSAQRHDQAVAGIADHLAKFWDPSMRKKILAHLEHGGEGLDPLVKEAVQKLGMMNFSRTDVVAGSAASVANS